MKRRRRRRRPRSGSLNELPLFLFPSPSSKERKEKISRKTVHQQAKTKNKTKQKRKRRRRRRRGGPRERQKQIGTFASALLSPFSFFPPTTEVSISSWSNVCSDLGFSRTLSLSLSLSLARTQKLQWVGGAGLRSISYIQMAPGFIDPVAIVGSAKPAGASTGIGRMTRHAPPGCG